MLAGDLAEPALRLARDLDRLAGEQRVGLLRALLGPARERPRPDRRRVGRDERLGEDDESRAVPGRLGRERRELVQGPLPVEDHRLGLDAGGGHGLAHAWIVAVSAPDAQDGSHPELAMVGHRAPEAVAAGGQLERPRDAGARARLGERVRLLAAELAQAQVVHVLALVLELDDDLARLDGRAREDEMELRRADAEACGCCRMRG